MNRDQVHSRQQLIARLRAFDAAPVIARYRSQFLASKSPAAILSAAVDSTIYRAFRYETPSHRYAQWRWRREPEKMVGIVNAIENQVDFDRFALEIGASLVADWGATNERGEPSRMNHGIAMKIANLVLKHLAFSAHNRNANLIDWLHVPWDSFTLLPLRDIWDMNPPIPRAPSQGFVDHIDLYLALHRTIADIAHEASIPRIVYEIWAWDRAHVQ